MKETMEPLKDASHLYEVEYSAYHLKRPGFRVSELKISPTQSVPWHYHSNVQDTFYVIDGRLRLFLQDPKEEVQLGAGRGLPCRTAPPAPCHQCYGQLDDLPRAAGNRRIRLRASGIKNQRVNHLCRRNFTSL